MGQALEADHPGLRLVDGRDGDESEDEKQEVVQRMTGAVGMSHGSTPTCAQVRIPSSSRPSPVPRNQTAFGDSREYTIGVTAQ